MATSRDRKGAVSVAVIGPEEHTTAITSIARLVPDIRTVAYSYESELEAGSLSKQAAQQHPVIMFAGPIPYFRAIEDGSAHPPMVYVPFTGAALCRALFLFRDRFSNDMRVSIDTVGKLDVFQTFKEVGRDPTVCFSLEYDHALSRDDFVSFHQSLYDEKRSTGALTALKSAYLRLREAEVPVIRIEPTQQSIIDTLSRAVLLGKNIEAHRNQLAVGIVRLPPAAELTDAIYDTLERLDRFVQKLAGHIVKRGPSERLFFTTRGQLEHVTDKFSSFPDILPAGAEGYAISMGIGFGLTVSQAYQHADIAVSKAEQHGATSCWLVSADKSVVGPIGEKEATVRRARTINPRLLELAESMTISVRSLQLFLGALVELRHAEFTVNDIAPFMSTSVRNSRRILSRMNAKGLIKIVGKEPLHDRGKPRTVFRPTGALSKLASETSRNTVSLGELERIV